jgi:hypothetical protein
MLRKRNNKSKGDDEQVWEEKMDHEVSQNEETKNSNLHCVPMENELSHG